MARMARMGVVVLFTALAVGCRLSGGDVPPEGRPPRVLPPMPDIVHHVALTTPSGSGACDAAEQLIEDGVVTSMRVSVDNARWWGGGSGRGSGGGDAGTSTGGGSYSTTNLQTTGVDEADAMKNDGTRIVTLSGGQLVLLRSWPDTQLQVLGRLQLAAVPRELLLLPDRVVVFSDGGWGTTQATFVDISDMTHPAVVGEVDLPGEYVTARRVGTAIRVVLRAWFPLPLGVATIPPGGPTADDAEWEALKAQNEAVIRSQPLDHWLPPARTRDAAGQVAFVPHPCDQVSGSNAPVSLGATTVATLDVADPTRADRWSILGYASWVYASPTSLYLASPHWWWWPQAQFQNATYVHRFDISTPATAVHAGSGVFEGTLHDSFGLDELDGRLRVATSFWSQETGWTNRVVVLEQNGSELVEVGRSPDFGAGEWIHSSRFLGTRAFVVTFRQSDPLFTLDLSNPIAPRLVGELFLPGFSSYLHPVSASQLVGVGTDFNGVQLSLFDVSDLAQPTRTSVVSIPSGSSEAQRDHHAFTWLPGRKLLAIPYAGWWAGTQGPQPDSDLRVFQVSGDALVQLGTLSLSDVPGAGAVRRGILTDQDAYAIAGGAARVARLSDLSAPVATANLGP